jgi:DNA polymerase-3 subunit epsilon
MLKNLRLERPLIFFDLETTGIDPANDRIVEIAALRVDPDGSRDLKRRLINPERPIPPAASAIHGIRDEDVRDAPSFRLVARSMLDWMHGADLAGFNVERFDVPLLDAEFRRAGLDLDVPGRRVVDAMVIFHRREPRDLSAAVRFYLDREHEGAHSAEADVTATLEVLDAQLERYDDLPRDVDGLWAWARAPKPGAVDLNGKFVWRDGEIVFSFGKYRDRTLREVVEGARDYLDWILKSDFPDDAKKIVADARDHGIFPDPPETQST